MGSGRDGRCAQVRSIFEKTGVHRQTDLVRLALSAPRPQARHADTRPPVSEFIELAMITSAASRRFSHSIKAEPIRTVAQIQQHVRRIDSGCRYTVPIEKSASLAGARHRLQYVRPFADDGQAKASIYRPHRW